MYLSTLKTIFASSVSHGREQEYTRNVCMVLTQPHLLIHVHCQHNINANVTPKQEYGSRSSGRSPGKRLPCSPTLMRNDHAKAFLY